MDKYFVPDIEDIRVGYVLEVSRTGPDNGKVWNTRVVTIEDNFKSFVTNGYIPNGYGTPSVRVPYLTKEQIEAEGWEVTEGIFEGGDRIVNTIHGFKNNFMFSYINNKLRVLFKDPSIEEALTGVLASTIYYGECKDINTFRYICKLLKVNG